MLQSGIPDKYMEHQKKMPYENGVEEFICLDKRCKWKYAYHKQEWRVCISRLCYESSGRRRNGIWKKEIAWLQEVASDYNSWVIDVRIDSAGKAVACIGTVDGKWMIANDCKWWK